MKSVIRTLLAGTVVLLTACSSATDTSTKGGSTASSGAGSTTPSKGTAPTDAASTGTSAAAVAKTFVGKVDTTDLSVAAVVDGDKLVLYLCDGHNGRRFDGSFTAGGSFSAKVEDLGTLTVARAATGLTGTLDANGTPYTVTAEPATGSAGLLWAAGDKDGTAVSAGWIVANDGTETGGVVTGISDGTSNLTLQTTTAPYIEQDSIIAILIGVRSPLTRVR